MKISNYTILIPSVLLQYIAIIYQDNKYDKDAYDKIAFAIFIIGLVLYVVGLALYCIPYVTGDKHIIESLRSSDTLDGLALVFLYISIMSNYLSNKYTNSIVALSWVNLVLAIIFLVLYSICWTKNILIYEISPTIVIPSVLFSSYKFNLFDAGTEIPFSIFSLIAFYLMIAFYGHIIYRFVRSEPSLIDPISSISGIIVLNNSMFTFFGVFLCLPLLYLMFLKLKSKEMTMSQLIVGDAGLVVGFAALFYFENIPSCSDSIKCTDAKKVFGIIGQVFIWLFILLNLILMGANIINTPLDGFLEQQNLPAKAVPPASRISVIQSSTSNSTRDDNTFNITVEQ